jgi:hypothetical protein
MTKIKIILCSLVILLATGEAFAGAFKSGVAPQIGICANSRNQPQLATTTCSTSDRYVVGGSPGNWSISRHRSTWPTWNCQGSTIYSNQSPSISCTYTGWSYEWGVLVPLARTGCPTCIGVAEVIRYTGSTTPPNQPAGWGIGAAGGPILTTLPSGKVYWTRDYADGVIRLRPYTGAVNQKWTHIP